MNMTTGKTIALTVQTFVSKVMSLFNMQSRSVITFLPRNRNFWISQLQSPSAVVLEKKKKVCHCFHFFPIYFAMNWWVQIPWSSFFKFWVLICHSVSWNASLNIYRMDIISEPSISDIIILLLSCVNKLFI